MHNNYLKIMGKKRDLQPAEKTTIVQQLAEGMSTLQIARNLGRDLRSVKKFVADSQRGRKKREEKEFRKLSARDIRKLKLTAARKKIGTSAQIFEAAAVPSISRTTRCKVLSTFAKNRKASSRPPLNKKHKAKRVEWAECYMKTDFQKVLFTDECRASLDGPDGWARGWVLEDRPVPSRFCRQQGGGGVMFWAAIIKDTLIGPFRVPEGVKINAASYCNFLEETFFSWWRKQPLRERRSMIFMHDNAPAHAAIYTREFMSKKGLLDDRMMIWPAASPDLNPIENLWAVFKMRLYANNHQFSSKDDLWAAIQDVAAAITPEEIHNLTNSVDSRLVSILGKRGNYIDK